MELKKDTEPEKLRGAYFTPDAITTQVVRIIHDAGWVHGHVLEPSCGDGAFLTPISKITPVEKLSVDAIELDGDSYEEAHKRFGRVPGFVLSHGDFFDFYKNQKQGVYDLVLGNPPYIRYQYLTEEQRAEIGTILSENGMRANKLVNAWVGFVVACMQLLRDGGHLVFVLPAELLQVKYSEDLREYLLRECSKLTVITFEKLVFPEIEQEVVVLMVEKGVADPEMRIIRLTDAEELKSLNFDEAPYIKIANGKDKWTKYFTASHEVDVLSSLRKDNRFAPFSTYGTINVGVTTGNNAYFSVDDNTVELYHLHDALMPLIGRSSHAHGIFFTKEDWIANRRAGKRSSLLVFPDIPETDYPEKYRAYIRQGEASKQNVGYKCKIRDRWYIIPSIWVPDAFFLRRNYEYPKFVLNECNAISTDTMHRMKINAMVDKRLLLLSYYNSVSFAFAETCGRSYGGGVLEILPGEMGDILIPKLKCIATSKLNRLLNMVDFVVRTDSNIENALDLVDREILQDELGVSQSVCTKCRRIWKKLKTRRLGRADSVRSVFAQGERRPVQMMLLEKATTYITEIDGLVVLVAYVTSSYQKWILQRRLFACLISEIKGQMRRGIDQVCLRVKGRGQILFHVTGETIISGCELMKMKCPKRTSPAKGYKLLALGGGESE